MAQMADDTIHQKDSSEQIVSEATTLGTPFPTHFEQYVGSLTFHTTVRRGPIVIEPFAVVITNAALSPQLLSSP